VTASNDDGIRVYDTYKGAELNTLQSKKYGVANICYTHDPQSVVYSSTKVWAFFRNCFLVKLVDHHWDLSYLQGSHAWRYHDLHANRYLKYFNGHTGRVSALHVSPKTDQVLSAAEDKQVRLWDLRNGQCSAMLHAPGIPTVAWDEQGLVFCVGAESGIIKLYDARNYSSGPFASFTVAEESVSNALFSFIRFSLDGKSLLAVVEGRIYVLDAFNGNTICSVQTGVPEAGQALEATLTPDGKYIIAGCNDRHIRVWDAREGKEVAKWPQHADIPTCIKFSPRKLLVASACQALAFWIPTSSE
jgi:COMPASS component SWD2